MVTECNDCQEGAIGDMAIIHPMQMLQCENRGWTERTWRELLIRRAAFWDFLCQPFNGIGRQMNDERERSLRDTWRRSEGLCWSVGVLEIYQSLEVIQLVSRPKFEPRTSRMCCCLPINLASSMCVVHTLYNGVSSPTEVIHLGSDVGSVADDSQMGRK
jgi:hypothetical protein